MAAALPLLYPVQVDTPANIATGFVIINVLSLLVWAAQYWRVALRGTRGDVSISMAIDVATMLLIHPLVAGTGSALGTALYHVFGAKGWKEYRYGRALVRGVLTFAAVALGGWVFRTLRPEPGELVFTRDLLALVVAISVRLGVRVIFYPLGMAALRPDPVVVRWKQEWERLPVVPFLLTTTLGTLAVLIWQAEPAALILLAGPLAATWSATAEFRRLNELVARQEDIVADRTARLAETVKELERRLSELEAVNAVSKTMVEAIHPDEVLTVIARESARVTGATSVLVTMLSDDREHQFVRAAYGESMKPYIGVELPIEDNLAGLVIRTGEPQISLNPREDHRLNPDLVRAGSWQSVIEAPLRAKDRVLGVLVVATADTAGFDAQHMRLVSLFANQAGLFLENARLHEKEREVAVLEERNRLARELHDSVTQLLFSLNLNLEAAAGLMTKQPEKASDLVIRSQEMAAEALTEMRSLIFELRPAALQEKGLAMALTNHVNLFRRRQGIEVTLSIDGEGRLAPELEFCLYRIAQEALHNVAKHARANHVVVAYNVGPDQAVLRIADDGIGFDLKQGPGKQSFGLIGMKERLAEVGGTLQVTSKPGEGTVIEARIPLQQHPEQDRMGGGQG